MLTYAFCLVWGWQSGCNSCTSLFSNNAQIESYIGVSVPPDLPSLENMSGDEKRNYTIEKQKEAGQGFAGARSPLGVIFLPIIAVMYLTLDEWWQVGYTDPKENKLTLRFEEDGKQSLIDGQIELPSGRVRHIAVLNLDKLKRRVLVELAQNEPGGSPVPMSIQKQVDLIGAYSASLSGETHDFERGGIIKEMLLVLGAEGVPLLSRLLSNNEPDKSAAAGLENLCRNGSRMRSDADKKILEALGEATLGPLTAVEALRCFGPEEDLKEAAPFFFVIVKSICEGNPFGIESLKRFTSKEDGVEKKSVPVMESDLQRLCADSPGAALVRLHLGLPTADAQLEVLIRSALAEYAVDFLDPNVRSQWDMLWSLVDRKPALIYERVHRLNIEPFAPTKEQVDQVFTLIRYAEGEKGLLSRDGYYQQAHLLDILSRADSAVLREAKQTQTRIANALKTAKGEEKTTLELSALLFHQEGGRRVEPSLLNTISEKYAKSRIEKNDPGSDILSSLKELGSGRPSSDDEISVDSEESLVYFALRRFGCKPDKLLEAVRSKTTLNCPSP